MEKSETSAPVKPSLTDLIMRDHRKDAHFVFLYK